MNDMTLEQQLQALPEIAPPPQGWRDMHERLEAHKKRKHERFQLWMPAAAVASFLAILLLPTLTAHQLLQAADLKPMMSVSAHYERQRAATTSRSRLLSAAEAATLAALEDDIVWLDAQIATQDPAAAARLWTQRIALMEQWVQVAEPQLPIQPL